MHSFLLKVILLFTFVICYVNGDGEGEEHLELVVEFNAAESVAQEEVQRAFEFVVNGVFTKAESGEPSPSLCGNLGSLSDGSCSCSAGSISTSMFGCTKSGVEVDYIDPMHRCEPFGSVNGVSCTCSEGSLRDVPTCVQGGIVAWKDIATEKDGEKFSVDLDFENDETFHAVEEAVHESFENGEMKTLLGTEDVTLTKIGDEVINGNEEETCDTACRNWKIGFLFIILVVGILGGVLPILLAKYQSPTMIFVSQAMYYYGGGILLSVALLHLLPHALEDLGPTEQNLKEYPLALSIVMAGFLLDFFIEVALTPFIHTGLEKKQNTAANAQMMEEGEGAEDVSKITDTDANVDDDTLKESKPKFSAVALAGTITTYFALSIHALFAGIGLGSSSWSGAVAFFVSIISHKFFAAFAASSNLMESKIRTWVSYLVIVLFSLVTPIGICIGLALSSFNSAVLRGVLESIATGMLLFVATIHTLDHIGKDKRALVYSIFYIIGTITIAVITIIISATGTHEAAHGGEGHDH